MAELVSNDSFVPKQLVIESGKLQSMNRRADGLLGVCVTNARGGTDRFVVSEVVEVLVRG